jgi:ribonuclease BN (tRNA processing enzyme)
MSSDLLRLTVLGSATPYASVDNPCSGYLVSSGGTRVWVDAGSGTLAQLQQHVRLDELDAIWISHLHADHSADLLTAYYAVLFADLQLTAPLPPCTGRRASLTGWPTSSPTPRRAVRSNRPSPSMNWMTGIRRTSAHSP